MYLVAGGELGGVVEGVHSRGVGKVVVQVLEWALQPKNNVQQLGLPRMNHSAFGHVTEK